MNVKTIIDGNDNLMLNKNKSYCIYSHGCFCPPHKGHFDGLNQVLNIVDNKKVKVFINQIGGKRHGVNRETNIFIMETYLKDCYSHIDYKLFINNHRDKILTKENLNNIDEIIILRGLEINDDNVNEYNKIKNINDYKYTPIANNYNRNIIIFMGKRYKGLSATDFGNNLIKLKTDKNNRHNNLKKCFNFIPDKVKLENKKIIIYKLVKFYLK